MGFVTFIIPSTALAKHLSSCFGSFLLIKSGKRQQMERTTKVQDNIHVRFDWVELHNQNMKGDIVVACGRPVELFTKECCRFTRFTVL